MNRTPIEINRQSKRKANAVSRSCHAWLSLAAAVLLAAVPAFAAAPITVTINPSSVNLVPNGTQQFTATVTGASDTSVTWTIEEGAAGGSITGAGLYSAPASVGVYHVIATSNAAPTLSATATVGVPGFVQSGLLYPGPCTSTLLSTGTILFTNGSNDAELYNPATSSSSQTGTFIAVPSAVNTNLIAARCGETTTLLPNGKVLFAGGQLAGGGQTATAEVYDPVSGSFSLTGSMSVPRINHTATLLPNGTVLITGGANCNSGCVISNTAEIYDPGTGLFTPTSGTMVAAAELASATLLGNGKVLIAGGTSSGSAGTTLAQLYDPSTGMFTQTGAMESARSQNFTATLLQNGTVLFIGGVVNGAASSTAEIYDPTTQQFSTAVSADEPLSGHTATVLANGQVLIAGGWSSSPPAAELYDPVAGTFKTTGNLQEARFQPFATLLANGTVVVAGGNLPAALGSVEVYDPVAGTFSSKSTFMKVARTGDTMTELADGRFLFVGGLDINGNPVLSAEIFDPATNQFTLTGALAAGRQMHTATLLGNGTVLVVGGFADMAQSTFVPTAELYNPASGTFGPAPSNPTTSRAAQTATALPSGKVLIAGGLTPLGANAYLATTSADLYDPSTGTFSPAGNMTAPRANHTATLLIDGRVLLAEGIADPNAGSTGAKYAPDELYDPDSGSFAPVGTPENVGAQLEPAPFDSVQWPNGQVLVDLATILDPTTLLLYTFNQQFGGVHNYSVALLPSNQVFVVAGSQALLLNPNPPLVEQQNQPIYLAAGNLEYGRVSPSLAMLPNGEVMIAGGTNSGSVNTYINQVEFYVAPVLAASPVITGVSPNPLTGFNPVPVTVQGANFTSGSVISLDGTPLATTIVSTTQLTATVPAITLTVPGAHTIQVQDSNGQISAPFAVTVNNPQLFVSQPNGSGISFGSVSAGGFSAPQSVNFQNTGNAPLTVDSVTIAGASSADFKFDAQNTNCPLEGGTLAPQQLCTAAILFEPAGDAAYSASLNFAYEQLPGSPFVVPLSGGGAGQISSTIAPTALTFGNQAVATASQAQSLTITNTGNQNWNLASVVLSDTTDFSTTNNCPASLNPAASCSILILFNPSTTRSITGSAVITSNQVAVYTIPLSGAGVNFSLSAASGSSTSATVAAGQTATYQLTLAPQSLTGSVVLTCAPVTAIPNATCTVSPNPATVNGSSPTVVTVTVVTTARSGLASPLAGTKVTGPALWGFLTTHFTAHWTFYVLALLGLTLAVFKPRRGSVAAAAVVLLITLALGCGSSSSSSPGGGTAAGTAAGNYQLLVTANSAGASRTITLNLTVQ